MARTSKPRRIRRGVGGLATHVRNCGQSKIGRGRVKRQNRRKKTQKRRRGHS
jgi:hypothetical protein